MNYITFLIQIHKNLLPSNLSMNFSCANVFEYRVRSCDKSVPISAVKLLKRLNRLVIKDEPMFPVLVMPYIYNFEL